MEGGLENGALDAESQHGLTEISGSLSPLGIQGAFGPWGLGLLNFTMCPPGAPVGAPLLGQGAPPPQTPQMSASGLRQRQDTKRMGHPQGGVWGAESKRGEGRGGGAGPPRTPRAILCLGHGALTTTAPCQEGRPSWAHGYSTISETCARALHPLRQAY